MKKYINLLTHKDGNRLGKRKRKLKIKLVLSNIIEDFKNEN